NSSLFTGIFCPLKITNSCWRSEPCGGGGVRCIPPPGSGGGNEAGTGRPPCCCARGAGGSDDDCMRPPPGAGIWRLGRGGGSGAAGREGIPSRNEGIAPELGLGVIGAEFAGGGWVDSAPPRRLVP